MKFYTPTHATVEVLRTLAPEQRQAVLRKILAGASEAEKDPHIARILARFEDQ